MFIRILNKLLNKFGYKVINSKKINIPYDIENDFINIYQKSKNYSITSLERMYSLFKAIQYVLKNKIPGDIVECGVAKGGSMMLCALTMLKMNNTKKKLYLYDTYEGMSKPTDKDVRSYDNFPAMDKWKNLQEKKINKWSYVPLEEVKKNLYSTGYPREELIFIKGKVEDTIPDIIPDKISILRLDTDWYESTYHELCYLFPKLSLYGVLI
ncbi:unnamed protein product, partial [marine sediment metagenome]